MVKLNLGCGPHVMQGWYNYDIDGLGRRDIVPLDLSLGILPHVDKSVDYIFSEHFIEHISRKQALKLLKECHRALKPKGVLRLVTPDLGRLVEHYSQSKTVKMPGVWEPSTPCQMINDGMRLWGHQYLYDRHEISLILMEAGFKLAWECSKHISRHTELCNLEVRPEYFEMYIEAEKSPITV